MVRDMRGESEFGLPVLPSPDGKPIPEGAQGIAAIPALTDAQAIADGAVGQEAGPVGSIQQLGHELRAIYAKDPDRVGPSDPATRAGTSR